MINGVTAFRPDKNFQARAYISLKEISHKKGELPMNDPNFRYTDFDYCIKYKPSANKSFRKKPFLIFSDVFINTRNIYRVSGYEEFLKIAEKNLEGKWFVENTIHSKELFDLVKDNPGVYFPIQFDAVKYAKKVMKNENKRFGQDEKDVYLVRELKEADKNRHEQHLASYNVKDVKL